MSMRHKAKWSESSQSRRTFIAVAGAVQVSLALCAWVDLARRPAAELRGSKSRWVPIIGINTVGPLAYFLRGRVQTGSE